jgi:hypothetical protein
MPDVFFEGEKVVNVEFDQGVIRVETETASVIEIPVEDTGEVYEVKSDVDESVVESELGTALRNAGVSFN